MGVPAFYRWISEKYGKIVVDMLERRESVIDGTIIPLNLSEPNPNGIEYDNLYVDMNGLIHPCSHPEDREAPKTEIEMYINVTKYIDRLLAAVRPRRLLFMAIDGVAPRAKMNQQRSRRFRAAQEADEKKSMLNDVVGEMVNLGYEAPEEKDGHNWDSNVITPGTDFMVNLSVFMKYYILCKMNTDPFWKSIKVIISDANEPGEGEHKIMDFIRSQRNSPGFDPNQRHILHGLDADLIMLALATHEAHFSILREKVSFGNRQDRDKPEKSDAQRMLDAQSAMCGASVSSLRPQDEWVYSKPLQVLHVNILREYLDNEFASLKSAVPFGYDIERIIDDFIFLCFFVGNDFLPHLPCLDIRDGALDFLIECYKQLLPSLGGYLSSPGGNLNLREVDVVLGKVGEIEDQIFAKRKQAEDVAEKRREHHKGGFGRGGHKRQNDSSNGVDTVRSRDGVSVGVHEAVARPTAVHATASQPESDSGSISIQSNMLAASKLKGLLGKRSVSLAEETVEVGANAAHKLLKVSEEPVDPDVAMPDEDDEVASVALEDEDEQPAAVSIDMDSVLHKIEGAKEHRVMSAAERESMAEEIKRRLKEKEQSLFDTYKESIVDHVKLHESGWKDRYYGEKYKKENIAEGGGLRRMCESYVQGLCWVMKYYYEGVPSWNWYYPFHYAPFASDLVNIDTYSNLDFTKSQPFRPVEQLLAVLPANSVHALPPECQWLMLDPTSPIIDLYNGDVPIDPNGKHLPWLWILLLPFVDERRIMAAFQLCQPKLSLQERRKNALGGSVMYVHEESVVAREAQQSMQYGPGVETDPDVLDALRGLSAQLVAMDDPTAATEREARNTMEAVPGVFSFDARLGGGLGGCLSKVHPLAFAPLHLPVKAPFGVASQAAVPRNRVMSFGYSLPPCHAHLSELLPGVVHQESLLTDHDLMPRRPPRLNKVGFNVVDLYHSLNRSSGQHYQQPSYQHNRDYQLTGQFQERQFHGQQRQQWDNASGSFGQQMGHASHGGGSQYQQRNGGYSQHGQQYHDNRNSQQHQSGGWGYSQQHQGVQSRSGATHYGPNHSFGFPQHQQQYGGVGGYNDGAGQQQSFRHEQQQGYGREAGQGPRQTVFLDHRVQHQQQQQQQHQQQQQQQQQQHFNSHQQQQQQSQSFLRQPAQRYQQQPGGPVPSMDSIRNQLMQTLQQQQQQPNQTYGQQARPYNSQRPF